nr:LysR substrate-binding domain-containing protein [Massilia sp. Root351]
MRLQRRLVAVALDQQQGAGRLHTPVHFVAQATRLSWVAYPPTQRSLTARAGGQEVQIPVRGDVVTDSAAARLAFVLAGEGVARLPAYDAAALIASGDLIHLLPEVQTAPLEIYLVHSQRIGPSAQLLREFLLGAFG